MSIKLFNKDTNNNFLAAILASLAVVAVTFSSAVHAQPPYSADLVQGGNKWFLDAYDDTDPGHNLINTVGLCFKYDGIQGTHQRYTWYSDTFKGWQGTASQEGDQIFMHGVYASGKGRDAVQVTIVIDTPRSGSVGHWQEWRDDGSYGQVVGFANARMIRDPGQPCAMTEAEALDAGFSFPFFPTPGTNDNPMTYQP